MNEGSNTGTELPRFWASKNDIEACFEGGESGNATAKRCTFLSLSFRYVGSSRAEQESGLKVYTKHLYFFFFILQTS